MPGPQKSFVWVELLTSDVGAAKAFYRSVVGWEMQDVPMPGMTYTMLHAGPVPVGGLMAMPADVAAAGMRPFWAPYIEVDDVDAAAAELKTLGGKVLMPPNDIPEVGRFAPVTDSQGAIFNLFKAKSPAANAVSREPGRVGWHELHAKDAPKSWDFYRRLFGWTQAQAMDMGAMGLYQIFSIDGLQSGAMFNSPAAQQASYWLIYFSVADIDEAQSRLTAAGGKVTHGPVEVPENRWVIQASDPQGAAFALVGNRRLSRTDR
jgi:predicted enzyme related to lactoylglutathione lyase